MNGYIIPSWYRDSDGDFTISNSKWNNKAWFRLRVTSTNELHFNLISSRTHPLTKEIYGVYHGRMTATLLAYFDNLITYTLSTSMPTGEDCI